MIGNLEKLSNTKSKEMNILVFAFVGDSVYTTYIRSRLALSSFEKSGSLNTKSNKYVCAEGQSIAYDTIKPMLNKDEAMITNVARNAKTKNIAKNSSIENYKKATSLEALVGYLYLEEKTERLNELLEICYKKVSEYYENRR